MNQRTFLILPLLLSLFACSKSSAPLNSTEVAVVGAHGAALSKHGDYAIIGSINHGGSLWRSADGERLYNWNHQAEDFSTIVAASFSTDGNWALTADPHTMVLWSMKDGKALRFWTAPGEILDVALSPNGQFALLGLSDHSAVLFDVQRGGIKRTFNHLGRVRSVAFSGDGKRIISGSEDRTAVVWDLASGKAINRAQHDEEVQLVTLSENGQLAFSASKYDKAILWNADSGDVQGEVPLGAERLKRGLRFTSARFSDNGKRLLTGRPDRIIQLWKTQNMAQEQRWELPKRNAWQPTGATVIALGFSGTSGRYWAVSSDGFIHQLSQ